MAETPYNHYALYEPDASPDLTATGEYNRAIMGIDSDMHAEETERAYADKQLSDRITTLGNQEIADVRDLNAKILAEEMNRVSADSGLATSLGKRIDNAEGEISANSADLTGIKSLTYGNEHVQFLENDNGSYSSPALDEIAEQVDALKAVPPYTLPVATSNTLGGVKIPSDAEIGITNDGDIYLAKNIPDKIQVQHTPGSDYVDINLETGVLKFNGGAFSLKAGDYGSAIVGLNLPFSTIGTGLKVVDDALTVDTQALPSALTIMQLSEFGELTPSTGTPYSATGNGNAAAYAKLKQAWPSVIVVDGGTTWMGGMYTPVRWAQSGYRLVKSAGINDNAIQMTIHGSGYSGAITLEEIGR